MDVQKKEKEWFRRLNGNHTTKKEEKEVSKSAESKKSSKPQPKKSISFKDVAGMDDLKTLVKEGFINVLNNKECAEAFGIVPPSILLYGPPGTGKSFFAESLSAEVGVNFIKVVPDDIASVWLHGTQEKIGDIFRKAEAKAPSILFFDEFEAMVPKRRDGDNNHQNGEVNEFLCQLNNASERGIYVIAASNHPESIDHAILRAGRIDEMIYVGMPDKTTRESLFRLSLSKLPSADDINYEKLADLTQGYNCSDISYIIKTASRKMFNESIAEKDKPYKVITQMQLEDVISHKSPSVTSKDLREYERIRSQFAPKDADIKAPRIGY